MLGFVLAAPFSSQAQQPPSGLKIVVLEGDNATNRVKTRTAVQPVVEVRDDAGLPVAGADVTFRLPATGPSAVFYPWMRVLTVRTDSAGRARGSDMTPNDELGRFIISVSATSGTRTASATISQTNTNSGGGATVTSNRKKLYIVVGVAAVGAIAGGIAASRNGTSSSAPATVPVTIGAGPITVGGPR